MAKVADIYFAVDPWKIVENGFDESYSRVSESVFSLGNENIGVRGCFDEGGSVDSLRGQYTNGVYDIEQLSRSYKGIVDKTHFMVPSADWLLTSLELDGETLDLGRARYSDFRRELDMRKGTLTRSFLWETESGKQLKLTFLRFLDMVNRERAYQRITLEPLNFSGEIKVAMGVSFAAEHEQRRHTCFWGETKAAVNQKAMALQSRTLSSGQEVFTGALYSLPEGTIAETSTEGKTAMLKAAVTLKEGQPVRLDKRVTVLFDGTEGKELWSSGMKLLGKTAEVSIDSALAAQEAYWNDFWAVSDISIEPNGTDEAALKTVAAEQQGIRFCSFQLAQTYNGGSMRHNIGAKGLTGEAYNGHAFWDTEACCLPFYLFTNPEAARDLLLFRYNTLPEALERAKMLDCKGACYPIATLSGEEACNLWQHASLQMQPSTAVAYGIWHYVHLTEDRAFLYDYGAEILMQIARYLVSRVGRDELTGQYGYYGVMGPDEFHMMVNHNAYTNYMGKRSLEYALEVLEQMKAEVPDRFAALAAKLGLLVEEPEFWQEVAEKMYLPKDENGLFEQHEGYFHLPHTDIHAIPVSEFPLYDHWSYDRIYRTDMIKQPDVLMFLYLYNSSFTKEEKRVNYCFYEPRTIHESSLSPAIHSILAAELGRMDEAVKFFGYATRLDLDNYNRNTREGLHITSIALAWDNIVYGFAGLRSDGALLKFAPVLPDRWKKLSFSLTYRGRVIALDIEPQCTEFSLKQGEPVELEIYGKPHLLTKAGLFVAAK